MRKKLFFLSIGLIFFASCKNDDTTVYPINPENTKTLLLGKWNMIKSETLVNGVITDESELKIAGCDYDFFNFKTDGTKEEVYHEMDCSLETFDGTWFYDEVKNSIDVIDNEDGFKTVFEVTSITKTDLKIRLVEVNEEALPEEVEGYTYLKR